MTEQQNKEERQHIELAWQIRTLKKTAVQLQKEMDAAPETTITPQDVMTPEAARYILREIEKHILNPQKDWEQQRRTPIEGLPEPHDRLAEEELEELLLRRNNYLEILRHTIERAEKQHLKLVDFETPEGERVYYIPEKASAQGWTEADEQLPDPESGEVFPTKYRDILTPTDVEKAIWKEVMNDDKLIECHGNGKQYIFKGEAIELASLLGFIYAGDFVRLADSGSKYVKNEYPPTLAPIAKALCNVFMREGNVGFTENTIKSSRNNLAKAKKDCPQKVRTLYGIVKKATNQQAPES